MNLPELKIGDLVAKVPVIQGGMGIGVSLHRLAGSVAREGGIGLLSTAQIGYSEGARWERSPLRVNLESIKTQYDKAKEIARGGIVGFNVMVASYKYEEYVRKCVEAGADVIVSGAGLPMNLPELVGDAKTKIAPIVSSAKAAKIILRNWMKKFDRTADFVVIEGPKAGGHLGFKKDEIAEKLRTFDLEVPEIIAVVREYAEKFGHDIPVIFAGGVWNRSDIDHYLDMGCSGVQMATRFIGTEECDAPTEFKQRFIDATEDDIHLTTSPVGMPGRAIHNHFQEVLADGYDAYLADEVGTRTPIVEIERCRTCLKSELCDRKTIPYCISQALHKSVTGDLDNALIFSGTNGYRIDGITTVRDIFAELNA